MKNLKIVDYNGKEIEGNWNGKIYPSKIENTKRIYINNAEVIITNTEADKITNNTVEQQSTEYYFNKLDLEERAEILEYLSINALKESRKETTDLYINNFEKNSSKYLLVETFKVLSLEDKAKLFKNLKNDYLTAKSLENSGNWHN